jgi:hypothetical protein
MHPANSVVQSIDPQKQQIGLSPDEIPKGRRIKII